MRRSFTIKLLSSSISESDPVCVTNISPSGLIGYNTCNVVQETVELTCSVKFSGNVPPDLQFSIVKNNRSFPIDATSSQCQVSSDSRVSCKYTTKTDLEAEGMSFICQSNRSRSAQYQCSTTEVRILCKFTFESRPIQYPCTSLLELNYYNLFM